MVLRIPPEQSKPLKGIYISSKKHKTPVTLLCKNILAWLYSTLKIIFLYICYNRLI